MRSHFRGFFSYYLVIIIASLIPVILFGIFTYNNEIQTHENEALINLRSINDDKRNDVMRFFQDVEFELNELRNNISFFHEQARKHIQTIQKLQEENIVAYYKSLEKVLLLLAQNITYIELSNTQSLNLKKRQQLDNMKNTLTNGSVFLVKGNGTIIYASDERELEGRFLGEISSKLHKFYTAYKEGSITIDDIYVVDFSKEKNKGYQQFMVAPIGANGDLLVLEVDQKPIEKILGNLDSLGPSAETYLVYKENNQTYLASKRDVKVAQIGDLKDSKQIRKGFEYAGVELKYGSTGEIELVGYRPLHYKNLSRSMQTTVRYIDIISPKISNKDYLAQFVQDYDFHDLMLVSSKGDIVYSVNHHNKYKDNIFSTQNSLSAIFTTVLKEHTFVLSDIDRQEGCKEKFSQFAAIPIFKDAKNMDIIIFVQLKIDTLTKLLQSGSSSYYKTLDNYIVGDDYKLKSATLLDSAQFNVRNSYEGDCNLSKEDISQFFRDNKNNIFHSNDYRGKESISVYSLIKTQSFQWAIVTKIDKAELEAMSSTIKKEIIVFIIVFSILAILIILLVSYYKKQQDEKLLYSATHDSLTKLPNRRFVFNFLEYILANTKRKKNRGAVMFMDLDNFKFINDSYGHEVGDFVLVEVSKRLKSILRENDILARLGGDEFLVIVNSFTHTQELNNIAQRIINVVSEPIKDKDNDREYQVGVSIGISVFPDDSYNARELLQFADTAMYKTKAKGRNSYTYYSKEMTQHSINSARVESELKRAIKNDELVLYYQPQIDIRTHKIVGVEALVRWMHPDDGLIMPNNFIPIAEESQLINELGQWVTQKACIDFKSWKEAGYHLDYVAVNMSSKQLGCKKCSAYIKALLYELDFNPEWLELEITENTLIENFERVVENIDMFKKMGISFSIDDFGTGYSSLSYLKSLKISTLKIDREFIKDILVDNDDFSIVKAVISMGHSLNYKIIAEGAESKEVVDLLRELGCDVVQGYYYSKPLKEIELLDFMDRYEQQENVKNVK